MKKYRFLAYITLLSLLLSLCSCGSRAPQKGGSALCDWFEELGFTEGLSQSEYIDFLDGLQMGGKSLTYVAPYACFEYEDGNGISGSCNSFSYGREEYSGDGLTVVSYLTISTAPDRVSFPYGIVLGDRASAVLSAFGCEEELDFFSLKTQMRTVYQKEGETLLLRNLAANEEQTAYLYPYQLIYTESYKSTSGGGTVDRSIEFYFSEGQDPALTAVRIHMSETD